MKIDMQAGMQVGMKTDMQVGCFVFKIILDNISSLIIYIIITIFKSHYLEVMSDDGMR